MLKFNRILLILNLIAINFLLSQTPEELKRFMDTYEKLKVDQQANQIVKKGIESESDYEERPVRLLVSPSEIFKYYNEKMNVIQEEISLLNNLINLTDSIPPLQYFGYNYFVLRDTVSYIDNAMITPDYILGYGDQVIISVWGQVEQYEKKYIQRDGSIFIDNVGLLYLGGKTISNAKKYIFERFSKVYSTLNNQPPLSFIDFSLATFKNINVTVAGNVTFPGNYVVNPSISLINLLIKAGGINDIGSLRNIYLSRENTIVDSIDLYPLISGNSNIKTFNFANNDIVIVPSKGSSVALNGSIKKPAYYEIKNDDIGTILSFAGGTERYAKSQAFIYRIEKPNQIINSSDYANIFLEDGDSLVIPKKDPFIKTITVALDGRESIDLPWIENLSYDDIFYSIDVDYRDISKIELTRKINYDIYERYILENFAEGDFNFLPFDYISIQLFNPMKKINTVYVKGLVSAPGTYPLIGFHEPLSAIIDRSGGLDQSIDIRNVIIKRDTTYFGSKEGNITIVPGDTIIANNFSGIVEIKGEVHNPGKIEWLENRSVKDYLSLAGGLTAYGDNKHIVYIAPYGEAVKIKENSRMRLPSGGTISISQKPTSELEKGPDYFTRFSSILSSLVTIAILANTTQN